MGQGFDPLSPEERRAELLKPRPRELPIAPSAPPARRKLPLAAGTRPIDERWRPIYAVWEITLRCDLACRHCGSRAGHARSLELTTAECLDLVRQMADSHDLLVTVEENSIMGGAGSAVGEFLAAENRQEPILHLGLPDYYVEHAKPGEMLKECGLDAAGIEAAVRARLAQL